MERYFRCGLAASTQRSYDSGKRRFLEFCIKVSAKPLPVSEELLCRFVAQLADEGLAPTTIKPYLSAVRHLQVSMSFPDPKIGGMARLEQVLKGAKREFAKKSPEKRERLPITPDILLKLKAHWISGPKDKDKIMLWAACCLCYFGFLRAGQLTVPSEAAYEKGVHLNMEDMAVDSISSPSVVRARIKASKTDQFRRGVDIFVGRTHGLLCPVEALLAYIAVRGTNPGFFFRFEDGRLLTKDRFINGVRHAMTACGVDAKAYAGHSFRIGAATTAAKKGMPTEKIKTLGRWASAAYLLYVRISREDLAEVSQTISSP